MSNYIKMVIGAILILLQIISRVFELNIYKKSLKREEKIYEVSQSSDRVTASFFLSIYFS